MDKDNKLVEWIVVVLLVVVVLEWILVVGAGKGIRELA